MNILEYAVARKLAGGGSSGGGSGGSADEWIGDGNTHIWISLAEGRTSPMLGVAVSGTITVDWGDGTAPSKLTGTNLSTIKYTSKHQYASAGDYVITLSGSGKIGFVSVYKSGSYVGNVLCNSSNSSDNVTYAYRNAIRKIEFGNNATSIGEYVFKEHCSLTSINISDSVTSFGREAFVKCYSLKNVNIPNSLTSIAICSFQDCHSLTSINIPDGVTIIDASAFANCYSLTNVSIPDSVTSIDTTVFQYCRSLKNVNIPKSVKSIGANAFKYCQSLTSINIPDGVTIINASAFANCHSITGVSIPDSVTSIDVNAFAYWYSAKYFDFSNHTTVPTLAGTNAFNGIPSDCEIRVPAALLDEWKAATNWSTYADNIVGV